MINQIEIAEMAEADKEVVRRVLIESYREYKAAYPNALVWEEYMDNIAHSLENPDVEKIFVAKKANEIIGTLQLFRSSESAYQNPELKINSPIIRLLGVHPHARGIGVGQELLRTSIEYAKSKGAAALYLHTNDRMPQAIRFYEQYGFIRDHSKEFLSHDLLIKCYRFDLLP